MRFLTKGSFVTTATADESTDTTDPGEGSAFAALRLRPYRIYLAGHTVASTGNWIQSIALDWLVLELAGSPSAVGIAMACQFLPILLFGMHGGLIADRFPKRAVLLITQSANAAVGATIAVLTLGGATPWVTAEVSSLAARWALKISRLLEDLVSSLDQLAALVRRVDEYTIELDGRPRAGGVDAGRGPDGHGLPSGGRPWDDLPGSAPGEGIPGFVPPPPHSGRPDLPTKALDPYFEGETDPKRAAEIFGSEVKGVRYLTPVQAERYRVFVQDGKLYHINGVPVDTRAAESLHGGGGRAIFVMDSQGNLYLSTFHERGYFHHSSLLGGRPVAGAGEMVVENGRIVEMTDKSGHYQPPPEFRQQVLDVLAAEGVDVSTIEVRSW